MEDPTNLDNLKILDAAKVRKFVEEVNAITPEEIAGRTLVLAIGTGGTIAMKEHEVVGADGQKRKIKKPSLDFEDMFQKTESGLADEFLMKGLDALALDSSQMTYDHVHDLAIVKCYIEANINKKIAGFLIIHGTDTMAEASGHMAMMMGKKLRNPMVYTGAQAPIGKPRSDGGSNLRDALYTIKAMDADDKADVVISFGDGVVFAHGAQKRHNSNRNAFDSPLHELAGDLSTPGKLVNLVQWVRSRVEEASKPNIYGGYSHLLEVHSKMSESPQRVYDQIMHESVNGVILTTYGAGTADSEVVQVAAKAIKRKGIPGFACNPAALGAETEEKRKEQYESEAELERLGFRTVQSTTEIIRAKFELAIRRFRGNIAEVVEFMHGTNYIGEIPTGQTKRRSPLLRTA